VPDWQRLPKSGPERPLHRSPPLAAVPSVPEIVRTLRNRRVHGLDD